MRRFRTVLLVATIAVFSPRTVASHDLVETSATLVVRDGRHVELRLQIPWADVLRRAWMPTVDVQEAMVRMTAQRPVDFARELAKLERTVEADVAFVEEATGRTRFVRWQWPAAAQVQAALRVELMSRLAAGAAFEHASRLQAMAELTVPGGISSMRLQLPALLGPALLSVSRPVEQWLQPGERSASIAFPARLLR